MAGTKRKKTDVSDMLADVYGVGGGVGWEQIRENVSSWTFP